MAEKTRHINIPVFIPHLGCPNDCVFCNQRSISGKLKFEAEQVIPEIEEALSTIPQSLAEKTEIAFFGGSFTGIDRELMISLLDIAQDYIDRGRISGIRLSTRPDYINDEIISILKRYGVKTVELGIQSTDDNVLNASKRGHNSAQTEIACRLVKDAGFELVGQMMVGLPMSDVDSEKATASAICDMGADAARVYPTVVFRKTELCRMAKNGDYKPLSQEEAVLRTKEILKIFDERAIPCIRVGLCASENLSSEEEVYGGANHSAIGELAIGELYYERMDALLSNRLKPDDRCKYVTFAVAKGCTSKAVGQKRKNIVRLCGKYSIERIKVIEKNQIIGYNIVLE